MKSVLEVGDLNVEGPGGCQILAGVGMALRSGEVLALVGETGSGKTTVINSILGLLPTGLRVTAGRVILEDENPVDLLDLADRQKRQYLGLQIGYVPQDVRSGLNPLMTAREAVREGARRRGGDYQGRAESALHKAGLPDEFLHRDANRRPRRLSGGQCQRVLIAQAIVNSPRVLLLDEPTASLDPPTRREVLKTIRSLADETCAICLVTHDLAAAGGIADRVAVMYAGRVVEVGPARRVLTSPEHPYTKALLECVPRLDRKRPMQAIPGNAPHAAEKISGCVFHPRCRLCEERCRCEDPQLREIAPGHKVSCHVVECAT